LVSLIAAPYPRVATVEAMSAHELDPQRHVALESLFNVRDLGGYRGLGGRTVRWRVLYRADGLHRLDGDDVERVASLGITTVFDLRTPGELDDHGRFPVDAVPVDYRHVPLIPAIWDPATLPGKESADDFLTERYLEMLDLGRDAIGEVVETLAAADAYPAIFHCAAGKDRTGMLAAVILSTLGVADDDVAADYSLTRHAMERMVEWVREHDPAWLEAMQDQPTAFLGAPAVVMHRVLEAIRLEHGSTDGYLASIGVGADLVGRVRENLLD
jgi:protein-tyrosine phosphatase